MLSGGWVVTFQRKHLQHFINVKLKQIMHSEQMHWRNSSQKSVNSPEIPRNEWHNIRFFYWSTKVYIYKMRQKLLKFLNVVYLWYLYLKGKNNTDFFLHARTHVTFHEKHATDNNKCNYFYLWLLAASSDWKANKTHLRVRWIRPEDYTNLYLEN